MLWDAKNRAELAKLRAEGHTQAACAKILRCRPAAISSQLHPKKKKPKPEQSKIHVLRSSCPMRRYITDEQRHAQRTAPQLTKAQLYYDLAMAVRNTARIAHH